MLKIKLLGGMTVERDGKPIHFTTEAARGLFAYLIMRPDHVFSREKLATLLFPELSQKAAGQNFRQTLSRMRKALGDSDKAETPIILATRLTVAFNGKMPALTDTQTFQKWQTLAQNQPSKTKWRQTRLLEKAVEAYGGAFLPNIYIDSEQFREWLYFEREQWVLQGMEVMAQLGELYGSLGRYGAMAMLARRQIRLEPWREESYQLLIRALLAQGKRAAAVAEYQQLQRVLAEELGIEPNDKTTQLLDPMSTETPRLPMVEQGNLTTQATPFFGREAVLAEIETVLLDRGERLLTLLGIGGAGKSRVARQAGLRLQPYFADGVWFVPLVGLDSHNSTVDLLFDEIGKQMGIPRSADEPERVAICRHLSQKEALIILDNAEHVAEVVAETVLALLAQTGVAVLVTSREPLYVQAEYRVAVAALTENAGIQLFTDRCQRVGNALTKTDRPTILKLHQLLEGIPLALELAAAITVRQPLADTLTAIQKSYDILATRFRDVPARQRSLRAVFDYSWALLTESEQQLLAPLALFRGGFTGEAAGKIAGISSDQLQLFADKSLVTIYEERFGLHEQVREFVGEWLQKMPALYTHTQRTFQSFYLQWLGKNGDALLKTEGKVFAAQFEADIDNIRATWQMVRATNDTDNLILAFSAWHSFAEISGRHIETRQIFRKMAAHFLGLESKNRQNDLIAGWSLCYQAFSEIQIGEMEQAFGLLERAFAIGVQYEDIPLQGYATFFKIDYCLSQQDIDLAQGLLPKMEAYAKHIHDPSYLAYFHNFFGGTAFYKGTFDQAIVHFQQALTISRQHDYIFVRINTLHWLVLLFTRRAAWATAQAYAEEGLELAVLDNDMGTIAAFKSRLCEVALANGNLTKALDLSNDCIKIYTKSNNGAHLALSYFQRGTVQQKMGKFEEAISDFLFSVNYHAKNDSLEEAMPALRIAHIYFQTEQFEKATYYSEKASTISDKHDGSYQQLNVSLHMVRQALNQGDVAGAKIYWQQTEVMLAKTDLPSKNADLWHEEGQVALASGNWEKARRSFAKAKDGHEEVGNSGAVIEDMAGLLAVALREEDEVAVEGLMPALTAYLTANPQLPELMRPFWVRQLLAVTSPVRS